VERKAQRGIEGDRLSRPFGPRALLEVDKCTRLGRLSTVYVPWTGEKKAHIDYRKKHEQADHCEQLPSSVLVHGLGDRSFNITQPSEIPVKVKRKVRTWPGPIAESHHSELALSAHNVARKTSVH
jgi:hypothetical protein